MRVTTAGQSAARDRAAIAGGTDGFALMCAAGTVAAAELVRALTRVPDVRLAHGVHVLVGQGNNGGDGYIVAVQLARLGVAVQVHVVQPPRSDDAVRAAALARDVLPASAIVAFDASLSPAAGAVVDALLGTGAHGPLRAPVDAAAAWCQASREAGALVVALDVPTGVDATTGAAAAGHVRADITVTFGSCKAGLLAARDAAGRIVVADIGLGVHAELPDDAARLADPEGDSSHFALASHVPPIAWNAHKGTRGRLLLVGGQRGMAGAMHLTARGALASGVGLVRAAVPAETRRALQAAVPALMCASWDPAGEPFDAQLDESLAVHLEELPTSAAESLADQVRHFAHAVAIGPGLGRDERARRILRHVLQAAATARCALLLDADALTLLAHDGREGATAQAFARCADSRPVVLTPHAGEFAALADAFGIVFDPKATAPVPRLEAARALAARLGCTVLLKGAPTVCVSAAGRHGGDAVGSSAGHVEDEVHERRAGERAGERAGAGWFVPRGSSALATGGTGDLLTGVLGALLATRAASGVVAGEVAGEVTGEAVAHDTAGMAACAAWVHGVAGELAWAAPEARGVGVEDVLAALPAAWQAFGQPARRPPGVLAELPCVR